MWMKLVQYKFRFLEDWNRILARYETIVIIGSLKVMLLACIYQKKNEFDCEICPLEKMTEHITRNPDKISGIFPTKWFNALQ